MEVTDGFTRQAERAEVFLQRKEPIRTEQSRLLLNVVGLQGNQKRMQQKNKPRPVVGLDTGILIGAVG
jgi:hypothetical protein